MRELAILTFATLDGVMQAPKLVVSQGWWKIGELA